MAAESVSTTLLQSCEGEEWPDKNIDIDYDGNSTLYTMREKAA